MKKRKREKKRSGRRVNIRKEKTEEKEKRTK